MPDTPTTLTTTPSSTRAFTDPGEVDVNLVGGKGYGLIDMTRSGLRVPPGFVISTAVCHDYLEIGRLRDELVAEVRRRLADVEAATGKQFGHGPVPLLLSVRSGAPVSMPGMMDTILNLGLGRDAATAIADATGSTRFMADLVFRFHGMYAETVLDAFEVPERDELETLLRNLGPDADAGEVYDEVWRFCAEQLAEDVDEPVPTEPFDQLDGAIEAVFRSWNTRRAITYRDLHDIPHDLGTAVVVQSMVFGNLDEHSGSGVVFTRNPVNGEPGMFGEYLAASQGEEVVAGIRTPDPVRDMERSVPQAYRELASVCARLEHQRKDILDIEFTVERGDLYLLQVRSAKRTARAAIRAAADLADEGVIDPSTALRSVSLDQVRQVQRPGFDPAELDRARAGDRVITSGVGASPGQVCGALYFDSDAAQEAAARGESVILARPVTSPTDLHGMIAADGIVTATGGSTSHAAVVARALGTACVVGCAELVIDPAAGTMTVGERRWRVGDRVSLDGTTGEVLDGGIALVDGAAGDGAGLQRLLDLTEAVAGETVQILGRAHTASQVAEVAHRGGAGIVSAIDDVLVTAGALYEVVARLQEGQELAAAGADLQSAIATAFAPILAEAGDVEVVVRGLDFHNDDVAELFSAPNLFAVHPQVAMPMGSPELVSAQLRGLAGAAEGTRARVCFVGPRTTGSAEMDALTSLRASLGVDVGVGAYVTNTHGLLELPAIAATVDQVWLELNRLQGQIYGIPARHLLTAEPLDSYVRDGLIDLDPRRQLGDHLLRMLDASLADVDDPSRIGVRISHLVHDSLLTMLRDRGLRRFAVSADEVRPARLAATR